MFLTNYSFKSTKYYICANVRFNGMQKIANTNVFTILQRPAASHHFHRCCSVTGLLFASFWLSTSISVFFMFCISFPPSLISIHGLISCPEVYSLVIDERTGTPVKRVAEKKYKKFQQNEQCTIVTTTTTIAISTAQQNFDQLPAFPIHYIDTA